MGKTTWKHTCVLGGFTPNCDVVLPLEAGTDQLFFGRHVYTEFVITDQLINFTNGEVLRHMKTNVRFDRVERVDSRTMIFMLPVDEMPDMDDNPSEQVRAALDEIWDPTINTFKHLLSSLTPNNEDLLFQIRYGTMPTPLPRLSSTPEPPAYGDVMAVHSTDGLQGGGRRDQ